MDHRGDLFSEMFGGAAGLLSSAEAMVTRALNLRSDDVTVCLDITLADVYNGASKTVIIERKRGCTGCRGSGRVMTQCRACQGNGITMYTVQVYPGIVQQVPRQCAMCRGSGHSGRGNCPMCHGACSVIEKRVLDVRIPKTASQREEMVFHQLGHHLPRTDPGDAVVILKIAAHHEYNMRGIHLFAERSITLSEAICGTSLTFNTLDDRKLLVHTPPGCVIQPESVRAVQGEGMAAPHNMPYGNLYIKFNIVYPETMNAECCAKLKELLPPPSPVNIPDRMAEDVEEVQLTPYDPALNQPTDPDSDSDYGHPPGVQCVHQ